MQPAPSSIPPEVVAALKRGDKIEAIKLLRSATGLGLKESKEAVERLEAGEWPVVPARATSTTGAAEITQAIQRGNKLEAIRLFREQKGVGLKEAKDAIEAAIEGQQISAAGLSPGEVKKASGLWWLAAAIVVATIAAYLFFGLRAPISV